MRVSDCMSLEMLKFARTSWISFSGRGGLLVEGRFIREEFGGTCTGGFFEEDHFCWVMVCRCEEVVCHSNKDLCGSGSGGGNPRKSPPQATHAPHS